MANYAYIDIRECLNRRVPKPERIAAFMTILSMGVHEVLGDRWRVDLAPFEDEGPTWLVTIPHTARKGVKASKAGLAPGENVGFAVALQRDSLAFRHGPNMFESWAQGCMQEWLADHFKRGVYFDATDETEPPGTVEYRRGKTFREYLERNFEKPLSADDAAWIERFKDLAPEGFW